MQVVKKYPHGTFCWVDLNTTNQDGARQFYTGVFGWDAVDIPIGEDATYTMFQIEGHDVAAAGQMDQEQQEMGMPSVWNNYISVDDLDAATTQAAELGATVIAEPFAVFDSGRMSVLQDPAGAFVCLWEAGTHIGASLVNMPGALCWNELATHDVEKAAAFYTDFLGWTMTVDEEANYYSFRNGERYAGGMMQITKEWGDNIPAHWMVYFAVEDTDTAVTRIKELGGQMLREPFDTSAGRMAVASDPQGAAFSIIAMTIADPPPGY